MTDEELELWKTKTARLHRRNKELHDELESAHKAVRQMSKSVDSVLAIACRQYGDEIKPGTWGMRLPEIKVEETLKRFAVHAEKEEGTGDYLLTCVERGK